MARIKAVVTPNSDPLNHVVQAPKTTSYRRLADLLRASILSGEFGQGQRLPIEAELAVRYGVGRSTAREALRLLASEGLVVTQRGATGGTFVYHPDPSIISERMEATLMLLSQTERVTVEHLVATREALEIPATRAAALRCDAHHLATLAATIPSPERVIEVGRGYDAGRDFHATVLEASGNPLLAAAAAPIFAVLRYRFIRDRAPVGFWDEVASDHRRILAAMQQHDPDAAVEAMESHLMKLRATYVLIDTAQTADSQELVRRQAASAKADGSTRGLGAQDHRP